MNPYILHLIFNSGLNRNMPDRDIAQKIAKDLGYKMFSHNGSVYSTSDGNELFRLSELIKPNGL